MTDNQKARAWDALKQAGVDAMENCSIFKPHMRREYIEFLGMMAVVEAKVLEADSRATEVRT